MSPISSKPNSVENSLASAPASGTSKLADASSPKRFFTLSSMFSGTSGSSPGPSAIGSGAVGGSNMDGGASGTLIGSRGSYGVGPSPGIAPRSIIGSVISVILLISKPKSSISRGPPPLNISPAPALIPAIVSPDSSSIGSKAPDTPTPPPRTPAPPIVAPPAIRPVLSRPGNIPGSVPPSASLRRVGATRLFRFGSSSGIKPVSRLCPLGLRFWVRKSVGCFTPGQPAAIFSAIVAEGSLQM